MHVPSIHNCCPDQSVHPQQQNIRARNRGRVAHRCQQAAARQLADMSRQRACTPCDNARHHQLCMIVLAESPDMNPRRLRTHTACRMLIPSPADRHTQVPQIPPACPPTASPRARRAPGHETNTPASERGAQQLLPGCTQASERASQLLNVCKKKQSTGSDEKGPVGASAGHEKQPERVSGNRDSRGNLPTLACSAAAAAASLEAVQELHSRCWKHAKVPAPRVRTRMQ
jgi:hypothetical protein